MMAQLRATDNQRRLDNFYTTYRDNTRFAKVKSKRLRQAIGGQVGAASEDDGDEDQ